MFVNRLFLIFIATFDKKDPLLNGSVKLGLGEVNKCILLISFWKYYRLLNCNYLPFVSVAEAFTDVLINTSWFYFLFPIHNRTNYCQVVCFRVVQQKSQLLFFCQFNILKILHYPIIFPSNSKRNSEV